MMVDKMSSRSAPKKARRYLKQPSLECSKMRMMRESKAILRDFRKLVTLPKLVENFRKSRNDDELIRNFRKLVTLPKLVVPLRRCKNDNASTIPTDEKSVNENNKRQKVNKAEIDCNALEKFSNSNSNSLSFPSKSIQVNPEIKKKHTNQKELKMDSLDCNRFEKMSDSGISDCSLLSPPLSLTFEDDSIKKSIEYMSMSLNRDLMNDLSENSHPSSSLLSPPPKTTSIEIAYTESDLGLDLESDSDSELNAEPQPSKKPSQYSNMLTINNLISSLDNQKSSNIIDDNKIVEEEKSPKVLIKFKKARDPKNCGNPAKNTHNLFLNEDIFNIVPKSIRDMKNVQQMLQCEHEKTLYSANSKLFKPDLKSIINYSLSASLSLKNEVGPVNLTHCLFQHKNYCRNLVNVDQTINSIRNSARLQTKRHERILDIVKNNQIIASNN